MRIVCMLCSVLVVLLGGGEAHGATFTVNKELDGPDDNPGNGVCFSTLADLGCSLRAAIQEANLLPGEDRVVLDKAGPYRLTFREATADAPDEDAAATGDLDVSSVITIETADGAPREIQVDFVEIQGAPVDRIFHVLSGGDLTLNDLILTNGVATSASTSTGGAILNEGTLSLSRCTLDGNDATEGGAIYNDDLGFLEVDSCTFANNGAAVRGGVVFGDFDTVVELRNSTFSGNDGPDVIRLENVNQATLTHLTIHGNTGTGIVTNLFQTLSVDIVNSIVSGSSVIDCSFSGTVAPTSTASLSSEGSCGFALTGSPQLGLLLDNGGPTLTHLPADASPALDAASGPPDCPTLDQRGVERPDGDVASGGDCDIGAVELLPEPGSTVLLLAALIGSAGLARRRA